MIPTCNFRYVNLDRSTGVTCGRRHQRVTRLDLVSLKLSGSIPPHVGNLSFLRVFNLQDNNFSHEIPPEIGRLRRLQELLLTNNSLSGEIPSNLSGCSQLIRIGLGLNLLVGRIPQALGTLSKLRSIELQFNELRGSVPYSFGNLSTLEVLYASTNYLNGSIPDIFGQLTKLKRIGFADNALSGMIPPSIFNLSSIERFAIQLNEIEGTFPSNLRIFSPSLQHFDISVNGHFTGSIPLSLSNASNLVKLLIQGNDFHGKVPSVDNLYSLEVFYLTGNNLGSGGNNDLSFICDLTNATNLRILALNMNDFGGVLPQCTANLSSSLDRFYVSANKLVGSIPYGIGNLFKLQRLYLSMNQFSGQIPSDLGNLQKLYILDLAINSLTGEIPFSFGNLSQLTELYFDENSLQGHVPLSFAECHNLRILSLTNNNLSGSISPKVIVLSDKQHIDLSRNHFTGSFPQEVGKLKNLEYLDISENMFFGRIPSGLGGCIKLEYLYMQENLFQEAIPSSLGSLRGIQELNLAHNNLSGKIPDFLGGLMFLHYLNLSDNNLEGMMPTEGVFKNATALSVRGNNKLCGGIPEFHLPSCTFKQPKKGGLSLTLKLIISLLSALLGVTFAFSFLYLHCVRRRGSKNHTSSDSENFPRVSYQSLLKATEGFSSSNLIGAGNFGSVYKGVLDPGETTVAVKVLNLVQRGASKSFTAECEALKNIRHRNLLKVLSACSGVDYRGYDFKALVYEFMVNGSLEEWLHPSQAIGETNERPRSLSFRQRLNIAIDIAMALDYLHNHCHSQIAHCDLKPNNVLLDDDMIGHVGDFGLVRLLPKTSEFFSGNQSSSIGVKGTIGYTPPEYGMGHEVWTQGDVYSYGILLLEMFVGKRPTDNMFQGTSNLHNYVKAALPEQVVEIVDPFLVQEIVEGDQMNVSNFRNEACTRIHIKIEEILISILEIGVACSADLPRERLDVSVVVARMCQIRDKL